MVDGSNVMEWGTLSAVSRGNRAPDKLDPSVGLLLVGPAGREAGNLYAGGVKAGFIHSVLHAGFQAGARLLFNPSRTHSDSSPISVLYNCDIVPASADFTSRAYKEHDHERYLGSGAQASGR